MIWGLYTEKPNEVDESRIHFKAADVIHMGLHVHLENTLITSQTGVIELFLQERYIKIGNLMNYKSNWLSSPPYHVLWNATFPNLGLSNHKT